MLWFQKFAQAGFPSRLLVGTRFDLCSRASFYQGVWAKTWQIARGCSKLCEGQGRDRAKGKGETGPASSNGEEELLGLGDEELDDE